MYIVQPRPVLPPLKAYLSSITTPNEYKILEKIITAESNWNPEAKNKLSTASGLAQFINGTWEKWGQGEVFNPCDNLLAMVRLYRVQGVSPWEASRSKWDVDK